MYLVGRLIAILTSYLLRHYTISHVLLLVKQVLCLAVSVYVCLSVRAKN